MSHEMKTPRRAGAHTRVSLWTAVVLAGVTGCAPLPAPTPTSQGGPPAGQPATPRATVVDTVPSRDAQAVLAAIPDPLAPGERVPAPDHPPARQAPGTAEDSTLVPTPSEPDSGNPQAPVPSPTSTLGERPAPTVLPADTTVAPSSPAPTSSSPPPSSPAAGDTCWRVQIAAPADKAKADRYREAAESQLIVPFVVEREAGLYKVRTRDCTTRNAADVLKRRAVDAGFTGVFRFFTKPR